jgi:hypothetical protein
MESMRYLPGPGRQSLKKYLDSSMTMLIKILQNTTYGSNISYTSSITKTRTSAIGKSTQIKIKGHNYKRQPSSSIINIQIFSERPPS